MENIITLRKLIGLLLLFGFENSENTRNELARPVVGTICLVLLLCRCICRYVFDCLWENNTKKLRGQNYVVKTRACSKRSFGILK